MSKKQYNPLAKKGFDLVSTADDFADVYVNVSGDTMEGDLEFPETGFVMDDGVNLWRVTIDDTGAIVTSIVVADSFLLLEDDVSYFLLENGDRMILG